jgi:hypothetical protein
MLWRKGPIYLSIAVPYKCTICINPHLLSKLKCYLDR